MPYRPAEPILFDHSHRVTVMGINDSAPTGGVLMDIISNCTTACPADLQTKTGCMRSVHDPFHDTLSTSPADEPAC